jgi:hypothetical protein
MILAYHRVASNKALEAILESGQIVPAIFRLHPDKISALCNELVEPYRGTLMESALGELVEEALNYFASMRIGSGTHETALKCEDILAGDAGRIFLSPGNWSEAGRGLGWPLSGFAFDAEHLIQEGAAYRPDDIGSRFSGVILKVSEKQATSVEETKDMVVNGFNELLSKEQLFGDQALKEIGIYRLQQGEELTPPYERRKRNWHSGDEILWDGPIPVEWAVEIWRDDRIVESKILAMAS